MTIAHLGLTSVLVAGCLAACAAPYPLHSNMTDDQIRVKLAEEFSPGMTVPAVESRLDELRTDRRFRMHYPRRDAAAGVSARPEVLLARLYPPGGFWIDDEDVLIKFVDVSFVFDDRGTLERFPIFRDGIRYYQGGVAYGPTRKTMAPTRDYPSSPPPPIDPLENAE